MKQTRKNFNCSITGGTRTLSIRIILFPFARVFELLNHRLERTIDCSGMKAYMSQKASMGGYLVTIKNVPTVNGNAGISGTLNSPFSGFRGKISLYRPDLFDTGQGGIGISGAIPWK